MRRTRSLQPVLLLLALVTFAGCSTIHDVRYVYQDADFGVVGLPENTDDWPTHYRSRAEKLIERHFPQGHEIVRAEEVIEGERTTKSEGSNTAEVTPQLPAALLNVAKLGHSERHSQSDTLKLKECRIVYRRSDLVAKPEGYARAADLNPARYIDPNDAERRKAEKGEVEKSKKGEGKKASGEESDEILSDSIDDATGKKDRRNQPPPAEPVV
jgi:hypothetical protein